MHRFRWAMSKAVLRKATRAAVALSHRWQLFHRPAPPATRHDDPSRRQARPSAAAQRARHRVAPHYRAMQPQSDKPASSTERHIQHADQHQDQSDHSRWQKMNSSGASDSRVAASLSNELPKPLVQPFGRRTRRHPTTRRVVLTPRPNSRLRQDVTNRRNRQNFEGRSTRPEDVRILLRVLVHQEPS